MQKIIGVWAALLLLMAGRCEAQFDSRPRGEFDLDLRSRLAAVGKSRTAVYTSGVRLQSNLAPGLRLDFYGANQYNGFLAQQATVTKDWNGQRVAAGILRLPFGIYDSRETYASGLIDYPMPRLDYAYNSVDWGVPGVQWSGGGPKIQYELAGFSGRASGWWKNTNNVAGGAGRVQTYLGDLVLGASHWSGYFDLNFGQNQRLPVHVNGLDLRWTHHNLLVRGEFIFGQMGGSQLQGWYLDAYYHLPKYQKFTVVARLEELRPDNALPLGKQITLGLRYTSDANWTFAVNWRRNNGSTSYTPKWTPYAGGGGDVFFQVYRKLRF